MNSDSMTTHLNRDFNFPWVTMVNELQSLSVRHSESEYFQFKLGEFYSKYGRDVDALYDLAMSLKGEGKSAITARILKDCLKRIPPENKKLNIRTRFHLAKLITEQTKPSDKSALDLYNDAERLLEECLKIQPNDSKTISRLGRVYKLKANYFRIANNQKNMTEQYDKAIELLKDSKDIYCMTLLGEIYEFKGDDGKALSVYNTCYKRGDFVSLEHSVKLCLSYGNVSDATKYIREFKNHPANSKYIREIEDLESKVKKYGKRISLEELFQSISPNLFNGDYKKIIDEAWRNRLSSKTIRLKDIENAAFVYIVPYNNAGNFKDQNFVTILARGRNLVEAYPSNGVYL